jgi:predicted RND superfamily exporter protein
MIYTWYLKLRKFLHSIRRQILNVLPHETLYKGFILFKKYWASLFKPVLVITTSSSILYFFISLYMKWKFQPFIILAIFIVLLSLFIVLGAIYGESMKNVYQKDD